jgi:pilus assembly protein CpaF
VVPPPEKPHTSTLRQGFIPDTERVIVIEDAAELDLTNTFVEYYLTKQRSSADDTVVIEFGQLLQTALRMRPDRIIVGEILSPEGADALCSQHPTQDTTGPCPLSTPTTPTAHCQG